MHFFLEIVLVAIGFVVSGGVLWLTSRLPLSYGQTASHCALMPLAFFPMWVTTHLLWHPFTGHYVTGYPVWLWTLFLVDVVLAGLTFVVSLYTQFRKPEWLYYGTWVVSAVLVIYSMFRWNPFAPKGGIHVFNTMFHAMLTFAVFFGVVAVGFAVAGLLLRLIKWLLPVAGVLMLAALLFLGLAAINRPQSGNTHEANSPRATPTATVTATSITTAITTATASPPPANSTKIVDQICQIVVACKSPGAVNYGSQVDFNKHTATHGVNDFTTNGQVLKSQHDVSVFLNGNSAQSKAAKAEVVAALKKAGFGQSEINRALDGTGYFAVQPTQASQMLGTTYFLDGKVLTANGWRAIKPGDVFWFYMTQNGTIVKDAILRADCGNSHLIKVRPVTPQTPVVPPATCAVNCHPPVCIYLDHPPIPVPPNGLCPKLGNSEPSTVPTQAQKHHKSKDNGSEISRGPVKPTDSGNGLGTNAPRSTPAPSPTGHKGSGPTASPTTEPAAPPSNTSVAPTPIPEPTGID